MTITVPAAVTETVILKVSITGTVTAMVTVSGLHSGSGAPSAGWAGRVVTRLAHFCAVGGCSRSVSTPSGGAAEEVSAGSGSGYGIG